MWSFIAGFVLPLAVGGILIATVMRTFPESFKAEKQSNRAAFRFALMIVIILFCACVAAAVRYVVGMIK